MKPNPLILDRVEGRFAVLIDDRGDNAEVPADWLPSGAREGDAFVLRATDASALREQADERLDRLKARAVRGDVKL